jgi:mannan endo-1,6-alpha-mannosidase
MVDYWAYTNDTTYVATTQQALMAQVGPNNDYNPPSYQSSMGNDDQAFWCMSALSALEYGFPVPAGNSSTTWLGLAVNVFNSQAARWDASTCAGGLKWQVYSSNAGYDYKNSISNGGFFQIAARLARYTGNQTYVDWAEKTWDWMTAVGLIDSNYNVYDGSSDTLNCTQIDHNVWTYNPAALLYGTAMLYNYTNGSSLWANRTTGLLESAANTFFSPYKNATNVMYEAACEPINTCDTDQFSFKAYLSRWMAKSAVVAPYISAPVSKLLTASAEAAARSCSGGRNGTVCGQKWYVGGYDGSTGIGQDLSALETVQSLLLLGGDVSGAASPYPLTGANVHVANPGPSSTLSLQPTGSASGSSAPTRRSEAGVDGRGSTVGRKSALGVWAVLVVVPMALAVAGQIAA